MLQVFQAANDPGQAPWPFAQSLCQFRLGVYVIHLLLGMQENVTMSYLMLALVKACAAPRLTIFQWASSGDVRMLGRAGLLNNSNVRYILVYF